MFLLQRLDHTLKKIKSQVANALTLMNLSLGTLSILFSVHGHYNTALLLIFLAALSDRFDGMIARKLDIVSEFGKQLDSLCDLISFGIAPALLIYQSVLVNVGAPGATATLIFIICGALRLARFNVTESNGYFIGVPITAAGCLLTLSYFAIDGFSIMFFLYFEILLALLMISPFKVKKV